MRFAFLEFLADNLSLFKRKVFVPGLHVIFSLFLSPLLPSTLKEQRSSRDVVDACKYFLCILVPGKKQTNNLLYLEVSLKFSAAQVQLCSMTVQNNSG